MKGSTLTVTESAYDYIPVGTTLTVQWHNVNQFSGEEHLTVNADCDIPNSLGHFSLVRTGEDEWTEIHIGLSREHEKISFEKN